MKISIIIPALNEAANIARSIQSAWKAGAAQVIVCDGGSVDDTYAIAQEENCDLFESAPGRAQQQNVGAAHASCEVLLFLHADNWFETDVSEQIQAALSHGRVVGGAFRQQIHARGLSYRLLERGNQARARWLRLPYGDQGIFARRDAFQRAGGFADVRLMEDVMLVQQLRRQGRLAILPGPLHVDARRWQRQGVVRQTLRNWSLLTAYRCGISPDRLATYYPLHKG